MAKQRAAKQSVAPSEAQARALLAAVADLDREGASALLAAAAPTEARDEQGRTPLMLAAQLGEPALVRALLDAGADPNAGGEGEPARGLGSAPSRALAEREGSEQRTPLSFAVESGELEVVETLLAAGSSPYNAGATTPLDLAVLGGDPEIVRALLDAAADPNERDSEGDTPLMLAGAAGDPETIAALIERGAIVSARNDDGENALDVAAKAGQAQAVMALAPYSWWWSAWRARRSVRRGRRAPSADDAVVARLHADALHGRLAGVRKALASGVSADSTRANGDGATALFFAARGGHPGVLRALIGHGADPNRASATDTPLTAALAPGALDPRARTVVVRALVAAGADIERPDADGLTPLMRAVIGGAGDAGALLVICELGADPLAEHPSGLTALELARSDPAKAHLAEVLEGFASKSELVATVEGDGVGRSRASRPRPHDREVETLRGLGDPSASVVVIAVRAPIDDVAPALESLRGGRQWNRDVYARDGLFTGKEGYLVYRLRGHDWTLAQTDLLDARALRPPDARHLSDALGCDALFVETCEAADVLHYSWFRDGERVEKLRCRPLRPGRKPRLEFGSAVHRGTAPTRAEALAFANRRFDQLELFVPGFCDDRLCWALRAYTRDEFERVDFLRLDRLGQES